MLLTLTTTHRPATDLGFLLVKHPERCQSFSLSFGKAHVFYPEATEARCTAALLLDLDPVGLVRGRRRRDGESGALADYVSDRPYVASSFFSVAIAEVFGTALSGRSADRQDLADRAIPLEASIPCVPVRGGEVLLRRLFEPLGYVVETRRLALDETFPAWGESRYQEVTLRATTRLRDLLSHLYVLLPVLDDEKHYWVEKAELEKLLAHGEGWLAAHPERELITRRYLRHQARLVREALARLVDEDGVDPDVETRHRDHEEAALEETVSLQEQRTGAVVAVLRAEHARRVVDLGCGEGRLVRALLADREFTRVVGVDVSPRALEVAAARLRLDQMAPRQRERVELFQTALTYRDRRLEGYDAATLVEVVEHLDLPRLGALERVVFEFARPKVVLVTTPNAEYNVRFENLPAGKFRHRDHRFEWTRAEFHAWAQRVAERFGYAVRYLPVGPVDAEVGSPTQMGIFTR